MKRFFFILLLTLIINPVFAESELQSDAVSDSLASDSLSVAIPIPFSLLEICRATGSDISQVFVITRSEIRQNHFTNIEDVLAAIPELILIPRGGAGQPIDARQGLSSINQLIVLINGQPAQNSFLGEPVLSSIPVACIERIEYLPPSSIAAEWGASATGIIHIVTHSGKISNPISTIAYETGANSTNLYQVMVSGELGSRMQGVFSYDFRETDGFRDFSESKDADFFGAVSAQVDSLWTIHLQGRNETRHVESPNPNLITTDGIQTRDFWSSFGISANRLDWRNLFQFVRQSIKIYNADSTVQRYQYDALHLRSDRSWRIGICSVRAGARLDYLNLRKIKPADNFSNLHSGNGFITATSHFLSMNGRQITATGTANFLLHSEESPVLAASGELRYFSGETWKVSLNLAQFRRHLSPDEQFFQKKSISDPETIRDYRVSVDFSLPDIRAGVRLYRQNFRQSQLFESQIHGINYGAIGFLGYQHRDRGSFISKLHVNRPDGDPTDSYLPVLLQSGINVSHPFFDGELVCRLKLDWRYFEQKDQSESNRYAVFDVGFQLDFGNNFQANLTFHNITDQSYGYVPDSVMPGYYQSWGIYWIFQN
ncbi:MAG: hypothetical protein B6244_11395 [Candidatus Cloacimonetes bacterium 4572_55]|nr:MAG: hypothetical protein B6244_11395 [Candidatus Cloacimonetes bacterium 4572_55]